MQRILTIIVFATTAAAQLCSLEPEVLFRSNAYTDSNAYYGGSVIDTQEEWDAFLNAFHPNNFGESLYRTSIDFSIEKVVIGSYFTVATCYVDISDAHLECDTSGVNVHLTMVMDVFDASVGCDLKCEALGQVVYAVTVPLSWHIDEKSGFQISATGPCVSTSSTSSSPGPTMLDTTTPGTTDIATQSTTEVSSTLSSITVSLSSTETQPSTPNTSSSASVSATVPDPTALDTSSTTSVATDITTQYTTELSDSSSMTTSTSFVTTQPTDAYGDVSTAVPEMATTATSTIPKTEMALIENSQINGTATNHGEDKHALDNETLGTAEPTVPISIGNNVTATTAPSTKTFTTTVASPLGGGEPAAILAPEDAMDPSNASNMTRQGGMFAIMLLFFTTVYFYPEANLYIHQ